MDRTYDQVGAEASKEAETPKALEVPVAPIDLSYENTVRAAIHSRVHDQIARQDIELFLS